ncbi:MAG: hypothetical protein IKS51_02830 [Erysipelotrichaceae bacterium]|nr:hypothetical protein [Erysipelotrichaceae bacterium]
MLKRFKERSGIYIADIAGQDRLAYSLSSNVDFYDLSKWPKNETCPGMILRFFDLENGEVCQPFEKKDDVIYGNVLYLEGYCWFLQADRQTGKITLYRYLPASVPEAVTSFSMDEIDAYNLSVMGNQVHVTSQDCDKFCCYYPEAFSFPIGNHETAVFIDDGKVYLENWIEEGWDNENNCASKDYRFYDEVIIRDFKGNILSKETGTLYQSRDGGWWIG